MHNKYFTSFLLVAFLAFSLNVPIAQAGVVVDIVKAVVAPISFIPVIGDVIIGISEIALNVVAAVGDVAAIVAVSVVTGGLCSPVGPCGGILDPFVEDLQCRQYTETPGLSGTEGCGDGGSQIPGGSSLSGPINSFTTLAQSSSQSTCTELTLSGINPQGHNYAILRDGAMVAELTSADSSFTDRNLTPHTNYTYNIRLPYPEESGYLTSDSDPLEGYTKCLPQCGFGVDTSSIAEFSSTNLRWKCINNDPAVDVGSCRITDSTGSLSQTVNAISGSLSVSPKADTAYTLTCTNIDGPISVPQNISVFKPGIKEINP